MRIRFPFAIAFIVLLAISSSLGLLPHSSLPSTPDAVKPYIPAQSDKAFHFVWFFFLSGTFYFIIDTSRRRVLHLTLFVCTLVLGVGSEVLQGLLPNNRDFDAWDVLANVLGSLCAVGLCQWFHKRSAERRRRAKYEALSGRVGDDDLELGEGPGIGGSGVVNGSLGGGGGGDQETGVTSVAPGPRRTLEEEVDNWDENAEDEAWDDDDNDNNATHKTKPTTANGSASDENMPKKTAVD